MSYSSVYFMSKTLFPPERRRWECHGKEAPLHGRAHQALGGKRFWQLSVDCQKMHNLKVESYDLFGRLSKDFKPRRQPLR